MDAQQQHTGDDKKELMERWQNSDRKAEIVMARKGGKRMKVREIGGCWGRRKGPLLPPPPLPPTATQARESPRSVDIVERRQRRG